MGAVRCGSVSVVRVWVSLWRAGSLRVRRSLEAALLIEWSAQGQGRVEVAVLCSLSAAMATSAVQEGEGEGAFVPSLSSAVLWRMFSPSASLSSRGRGVTARRLLPLLLSVTARPSTPIAQRCDSALVSCLVDLWRVALQANAEVEPSFLPSSTSTPLAVLGFPRPPLLSALIVAHPPVGDLFLLLCLVWEPLLSALPEDGAALQSLLDLVLSCAAVGLSSGDSAAASQCTALLRRRADCIDGLQRRRRRGGGGEGGAAEESGSCWPASTQSVSALRSAVGDERKSEWLEYLAVWDAVRSSQPHLLLAVWPRLYPLRLPCAFLLLLIDKALASSLKTHVAQHLMAHLRHIVVQQPTAPLLPTIATSSAAAAAASTSTVARLAPALVVQSLLRFTNQGHGEVGSASEQTAGQTSSAAADAAARSPSLWGGGSELSAQLRRFYADFISALPLPSRAAFIRAYLRNIDTELTSHLALRQHLHILAAAEPLPALGDESYAHLRSLLSTRIHLSSALLKPQLIHPLIAVVCRLSNFARSSATVEHSQDCGLSLSTFAELLAALPSDSFHPSSAHQQSMVEQMRSQKAVGWLAELSEEWRRWLQSADSGAHAADADGPAEPPPHQGVAARHPARSTASEEEGEDRAMAAMEEVDVGSLCRESLRLASLFVLLCSLPSVSTTQCAACCAPLSQALQGLYSRAHQPMQAKLRAVSLLAYVVVLSLHPSSSLACFPTSLHLVGAHLPSGELLWPHRRPVLSALLAQHSTELLAFADAALSSAEVDDGAGGRYRALLLPLLFALFAAFSEELPPVLRYQQRLGERCRARLRDAAEAQPPRACTALLTWMAALAVAMAADAPPSLSSSASRWTPLRSSSDSAQLVQTIVDVRMRQRPSSSRTHSHLRSHPSAAPLSLRVLTSLPCLPCLPCGVGDPQCAVVSGAPAWSSARLFASSSCATCWMRAARTLLSPVHRTQQPPSLRWPLHPLSPLLPTSSSPSASTRSIPPLTTTWLWCTTARDFSCLSLCATRPATPRLRRWLRPRATPRPTPLSLCVCCWSARGGRSRRLRAESG